MNFCSTAPCLQRAAEPREAGGLTQGTGGKAARPGPQPSEPFCPPQLLQAGCHHITEVDLAPGHTQPGARPYAASLHLCTTKPGQDIATTGHDGPRHCLVLASLPGPLPFGVPTSTRTLGEVGPDASSVCRCQGLTWNHAALPSPQGAVTGAHLSPPTHPLSTCQAPAFPFT